MKTDFFLGLNPNGFHKIAVHEWGDAGSSGVPVICVHGLGRTGRDFDRLAERLASQSAVYCPDMPGRGQSDNLPDAEDYTFTQYMNDLTVLIARTGVAQVDFVGTSMGGLLGMMLAALPHNPIRRLVINDVGPTVPQAALDRLKTYLTLDLPLFDDFDAYEQFLRKVNAAFGSLSDADWHHMARVIYRRTPEGKITWPYDPKILLGVQKNAEINLWSAYDAIKCPTLLIHGAKSDLLPDDMVKEMLSRGPRPKLYTVEDAGHAPMLMDEVHADAIRDFLEG